MTIKNCEYILSMENITKIYKNGFVANKNINFSIKPGEIHGLVGENGAGKSTLMKVLFGQEQPEEGRIIYKGEEIKITSPLVALDYGIGMVHQHFMLVPSLSVAENMVIGNEPKKNGFFDLKKAAELTKEVSEKYGLPIDPTMKVKDLYVGHKQRVEILKMLLRNVEVLILDEPTAVLTPQETEELFAQLKILKEKGHTIVFISHKLNEIKQICDRITVLRQGESVATVNVSDVSEEEVSKMMIGRNALHNLNKKKCEPKEVALSVRNINYFNKFEKQVLRDVNFDVRAGEILAIAGVEGNGQKELSEIITKLDQTQDGNIKILNQEIDSLSIRDIREMGVSHISEDRNTYGTVSEGSIEENLISDRYYKDNYSKGILLNQKYISEKSKELIEDYSIKCDSSKSDLRTLSGGNVQKVVAAREFSSTPKVIIANQPTRGIDVGASELIRNKIIENRDNGAAVLLISADLGEILDVSDNIIVMYDGEIVAYLENTPDLEESVLGEYMLGVKKQSKEEIARACH